MYSLRSGRKEKGDLMTDVCRGIFGWGGGVSKQMRNIRVFGAAN